MKKWIWIWAAAALVGCGRHLERVGSVDIVPEPSDIRVGEGVFSLTRRTEIRLSDGDSSLARAAGFFGELAGKSLGRPLAVVRGGGQESGTVCVALGDLPAEAYVLSVRSARIDLTGGSPAGVFYGFQTLRQMLPESALRGEKARAIDLPVVEIRDEPRIGYRALLLDAGRHFFGPEEVKSVIDLMAMHKLNRLQWHLTEDQGWRIEIRKYPELTRRGAWRDRSDLRPAEDGRPEKDPQPYGGYYTQQQVREIVRYAADRFIEIVPEIEMPGHAMAALASYPWLGCLGEGYEVPSLWGVKEDVYCAGKDSTFVFLEDVLTEVTDLFPYGLVHIGGDECPKARWKECPRCQRRMRDEGLGSEEELQSYFVRRIERFLASRNRRMVGWDEIRQGGLSETAIVLSRKREQGLRSALENGNDVIMTPYLNCYFDYYQGSRETEPLAFGGFLPLRTAYDLDPFEGLNAEQSRRILGVQCNLWTEFVATLDHAEYMLLPRLAAFAERAWTGGEGNYPDFLRRLESFSRLYDAQGYEYRDFRPEADSLRASLGS
ncbi:beta-N-acetylhexosaminidase [Alistipes ihumii]|uniref:beta-N-acetylhexosaminidase n=1 Tax=Alistipes ihumii TaxID=1470347 RepID=UPI002666323C|nr:beta-N-acetylhexosaminidase [Alistipes ihumii]